MFEIEWHDILVGTGAAYSVSSDPPDYDTVAELHKVVREVTGFDPSPPPKRIGFY